MAICGILQRGVFDLGMFTVFILKLVMILQLLSLKTSHCDRFSSLTGLSGSHPECQNKTILFLACAKVVRDPTIPPPQGRFELGAARTCATRI